MMTKTHQQSNYKFVSQLYPNFENWLHRSSYLDRRLANLTTCLSSYYLEEVFSDKELAFDMAKHLHEVLNNESPEKRVKIFDRTAKTKGSGYGVALLHSKNTQNP